MLVQVQLSYHQIQIVINKKKYVREISTSKCLLLVELGINRGGHFLGCLPIINLYNRRERASCCWGQRTECIMESKTSILDRLGDKAWSCDKSYQVGEFWIKEINHVEIPEGVWIRYQLRNRTLFPFTLGDYRAMRLEGDQFDIVLDPVKSVHISPNYSFPVERQMTLKEFSMRFPMGPVNGEIMYDHNGFELYRLESKTREYRVAVAFFKGANYLQKEVVIDKYKSLVEALPDAIEIVVDKPKKKEATASEYKIPDKDTDYSFVNDIFNNAIELNPGKKSKRTKAKDRKGYNKIDCREDKWR